jgi:hypothetical protein
MKQLVFFGLYLLIGTFCILFLRQTEFFAIDSCLDAGGSWHYDKSVCDFDVNYTGPR